VNYKQGKIKRYKQKLNFYSKKKEYELNKVLKKEITLKNNIRIEANNE
jgi:hypothetical protein